MAKRIRTNNDLQNTETKDLQNITQKTKDRATPTPLKTGSEFMCSGRVNSFMVLKPSVFIR